MDAPLPWDHHGALGIYESDMGRAREREGEGERGADETHLVGVGTRQEEVGDGRALVRPELVRAGRLPVHAS